MSPAFLCTCCLLRYRSDRRIEGTFLIFLQEFSAIFTCQEDPKRQALNSNYHRSGCRILPRICRWEPQSIVFWCILLFFWQWVFDSYIFVGIKSLGISAFMTGTLHHLRRWPSQERQSALSGGLHQVTRGAPSGHGCLQRGMSRWEVVPKIRFFRWSS